MVGGGGGSYLSREDERYSGNTSRFRVVSRSLAEEERFDVTPLRTGTRSGVLYSVMNMAKGALGGGVMAGHVAFMTAGILPGIILDVLFGAYMGFNFWLLTVSIQRLCRRCQVGQMTYPDAAEAAVALFPNPKVARCSKCFRAMVDFMTCVQFFGACATYQLMIGKTIKQLVENVQESTLAGRPGYPHLRVYIACMLIPIIIICLITEIKYLAPFSLGANAVIGVALICTIYYAATNNPGFEHMSTFTKPFNLIKFTGMSVFAMSYAGVVIPVENNMKEPKKFWIVFLSANVIVVTVVFVYSFFGYAAFLDKCVSPITMNFPLVLTMKILKAGIGLMIYVTHAVNFFMPFNCCYYYIKKCIKEKNHYKGELICRALIVIGISCFAIAFPNIDAMMGFLGSFCLSNLAFIFPNIVYVLVHYDRPGKNRRFIVCRSIVLAFFGIFILVCGTGVNGMDMVKTFMEAFGGGAAPTTPHPK